MTCKDCSNFKQCSAMFGIIETDEICEDFNTDNLTKKQDGTIYSF